MHTVYDFLTIFIFAGLIVVFLQRSMGDYQGEDPMWRYLVAAVGCAAANYLGNEEYAIPAVLLIVATLAFIVHTIRPFPRFPRP